MADSKPNSEVENMEKPNLNGDLKKKTSENSSDEDIDFESILNGAQLAEQQPFKNKKGKEVLLTPVIVDFRRVVQSKCSVQVVPGVDNSELLHAVVGLYDVSLTEMTPDVLYTTVCEKWARTIILVMAVKDAIEDLEERKNKKKDKDVEDKSKDDQGTNHEEGKENEEEEDVWQPEDSKPTTFSEVFSDSDVSEDEESSEEEEEDFSKGINAFLEAVRKRKDDQRNATDPLEACHVGPESRIVAATTFEKTYVKSKEKVNHLTLLAVRKRFRKFGIGKYLISQVKDPSVVGDFDAVVVHADNSATDFFEKYGFSDDIVLNSRWVEIAEQFTNCTLMCYLPPFTDQTALNESIPELDLLCMEREIRQWREKSVAAYRAEVSCVNRMREEIIHLRALASSQHSLIKAITLDNRRLQEEKNQLERDYLEYRFIATKATLQNSNSDELDDIEAEELIQQLEREVQYRLKSYKAQGGGKYRGMEEEEAAEEDQEAAEEDQEAAEEDITISIAQQTEEEENGEKEEKSSGSDTYRVSASTSTPFPRPPAQPSSLLLNKSKSDTHAALADPSFSQKYPFQHDGEKAEPLTNAKEIKQVTEQFLKAVKQDPLTVHEYSVKLVSKAQWLPCQEEEYVECLQTLRDPGMVTRLYYCGSLDKQERIKHIFSSGFGEQDYSHGDYGRGLYFSKYPTKAAQFSVLGKLVIAEVGLGETQTVVKKERNRTSADDRADSIITPGRIFSHGDIDNLLCQEYVVFNHKQVRPLYLIEYDAIFK